VSFGKEKLPLSRDNKIVREAKWEQQFSLKFWYLFGHIFHMTAVDIVCTVFDLGPEVRFEQIGNVLKVDRSTMPVVNRRKQKEGFI